MTLLPLPWGLGRNIFYNGVASRFQSNSRPKYWVAIKQILKYLQSTRDYMLVYFVEDLTSICNNKIVTLES